MVRQREARRYSLWRRLQRSRGHRSAARRFVQRRGIDRFAPSGPRRGSRFGIPRRPHSGRRSMVRRWKISSAPPTSPCAIFRSPSSFRRWADGSPPVPAAISRRFTLISMISLSRLRVVTPTGTIETRRLPGSGAGPAPTGCSSARKELWASSPRPGCDCRTARAFAPERRSRSTISSVRCAHCAGFRRLGFTRPIAACSIPAKR